MEDKAGKGGDGAATKQKDQGTDDNFAKLKEGLAHLWATRFAEADACFAPFKDEDPVAAGVYAQCAWIQAMITESPDDAKSTFDRIEKAQQLAEPYANKKHWKKKDMQPLDKKAHILWGTIVLAETTLFESTLKFKLQKHVKGAYNFRKSWKHFEDAQQQLAKMEECPMRERLACSVNFGVGFFHFLISVIPRQFLWLAEAVGFKADRKRALQELEESSHLDGLRQIEARFIMVALKMFFFEEREVGLELFNGFLKDYPDSVMVKFLGGWVARMNGELERSTSLFTEAAEECKQCEQLRLFILCEVGGIHFIQLDWRAAALTFERFLEESKTIGMRALIQYQLGICYAMLFHEEDALRCMKDVFPSVRKGYGHDEFAGRRAKKYLDTNGLTDFERKFIRARLQYDGRQFEDGLASLEQVALLVNTDEEKACHAFMRAECHRGLKQNAEAEPLYKEVVGIKVDGPEMWVIPWAYAALGEMAVEAKDMKVAKDYFSKAKKFRGYDHEAWVHWRLKRGLDRIRTGEDK